MDWNKVNWFAFFPPLFSIYLMLISGLSKNYLIGQVSHAAGRGALTPTQQQFVGNMASGWAAQLGFISAMLASIFSVISVWSASRSFAGVVISIALLVFAFTPTIWLLFRYEPDQIVAEKVSWSKKLTPAMVCKVVLLLVNVLLVAAIATSQQLAPAK